MRLNGIIVFLSMLVAVAGGLSMRAQGALSAGNPASSTDPVYLLNTFGVDTMNDLDHGDYTKMPIPRVNRGSSSVMDAGLQRVAGKLSAFFSSDLYLGFVYILTIVCFGAGLAWKGRELIWGEKEIGEVFTWLFVRLVLVCGILFATAPVISSVVVNWMNSVSDSFVKITGIGAGKGQLSPGVAAAIYQQVVADNEWLGALAGSKIQANVRRTMDFEVPVSESVYHGNKGSPWGDSRDVVGSDGAVIPATFESTLMMGFPGLTVAVASSVEKEGTLWNSTKKQVEVGSLSYIRQVPYSYRGSMQNFVVPPPYNDFKDVFDLYAGTLGDTLNGVTGDVRTLPGDNVQVRPLVPALLNAGEALYKAGVAESGDAPNTETVTGHGDAFSQALIDYQLASAAARATYLRDYVAWTVVMTNDRLIWNPARPLQTATNETDGSVVVDESVTKLAQAGLEDLSMAMEEYRKSHGAFGNGGWVMGALVPIALALVGFYVTAAAYSLPILLALWIAFFCLPEQLELSNALKKGFTWMVSLFLIPIFATVVVDIAFAFVDAVKAAAMSGWLHAFSVAATGAVGSAFGNATIGSIGVSVFGCGATIPAGLATGATLAGAAAWNANLSVFTWVAWVVAFVMIVGIPKLVSAVVSGSAGFASSLVDSLKMQGIMSAGALAMLGSQSAGGRGVSAGGGGGGYGGASGGGGGGAGGGSTTIGNSKFGLDFGGSSGVFGALGRAIGSRRKLGGDSGAPLDSHINS